MNDSHPGTWSLIKEWLVPPLLIPLLLAIGLSAWIVVRPLLDTPDSTDSVATPPALER